MNIDINEKLPFTEQYGVELIGLFVGSNMSSNATVILGRHFVPRAISINSFQLIPACLSVHAWNQTF